MPIGLIGSCGERRWRGVAWRGETGKIRDESTGGTSSGNASGNPPVEFLSEQGLLHFNTNKEIPARLKQHGFDATDDPESEYILEHVSYQHLRPYIKSLFTLTQLEPPNIKIAHDLLTFDRRMQSVLLRYIGIFESQFKAQYLASFAAQHGAYALYAPDLFLRANYYETSLGYYESEVAKRVSRDGAYRRHYKEGDGKLPLWMGLECMTLGTVASFYSNTADRKVTDWVAGSFGVTKSELVSWTKTITSIRNICAHFEPLFVRKQLPAQPKRIKGTTCPRRAPLYSVVLVAHLLRNSIDTSDKNLEYGRSLETEASIEIEYFQRYFNGAIPLPNFPFNWRTHLHSI